jgi:hypothetical protein
MMAVVTAAMAAAEVPAAVAAVSAAEVPEVPAVAVRQDGLL